MRKLICACLLSINYLVVFAQIQEQPKQTSSFQRTTFGFGIDLINANNIRLNNPAFYIDWLYRSKSKSFMGGLELESSFFYNGADKKRASNTPDYINKNAAGIVGWFRVVKKEKTGIFGDQIYLGGGASVSPGENTFDYTKWMAGLRCDYGQQYLRLGYRYYNFIGTENQNMVFFTIGTTF